MDTRLLDYHLPEELIAQQPVEPRDTARMLVLNRADHSMTVDTFRNVAAYLKRGDCLVLNDTKVICARLRATRPTGGRVEIFLLKEIGEGRWEALVRPSSRLKPGTVLQLSQGYQCRFGERIDSERRIVEFHPTDVFPLLQVAGETPLPPYIARVHADARDRERYQTIYAKVPGAVAAPTAGLHFTPRVFESLDAIGVRRTFVTLHVGYGTFRPVRTDRLEKHDMDAEVFELPAETAATLNETRAQGGRVVAVGTTTTRVLETQHREGRFQAGSGETKLFIYPPYTFQGVDVLQTNFHLPRSTLLALVCAFAGTDFVLEAYRFAVKERFRFYSYGDVMLIL